MDDATQPAKRRKKVPKPDAYLQEVKDRKLRGQLAHKERVYAEANKRAAKVAEWLLPAEPGFLEAEGTEETWRFQQQDIVAAVESGAGAKAFDLSLPQLGPYNIAFSRAGRHMLLGGTKGHLAMMEWQPSHLTCEVQVKETTRDVCFLHNEQFFAAAQKKYVYIYDKRGLEVHRLKEHGEPHCLDFLPHHFLLTSVGEPGILHYQDVSTGVIVAQHKARLGPCSVMRQNPYNAVMCLGHTGGVVSMWSPNMTNALVKMQCHRGPVKALCVDPTGNYLVTSGVDCQVKVWDIRTYQPLHAYFANSPATTVDISQRGMLAIGQGRRVQVWHDALAHKTQAPYMSHVCQAGGVSSLRFCPYEDVLGLGHVGGVSTILVPGAGEPNFDTLVANPYAGKKERQEAEVVQLLDKLQPETIVLDPDSIGKVQKAPSAVQKERHAEQAAANASRAAKQRERNDSKTKMKGKNKPTRRHKKKQENIIEERIPAIKERMREQEKRKLEAEEQAKYQKLEAAPRALKRFYK